MRGRAADSELGHRAEPQGRLPKALLVSESWLSLSEWSVGQGGDCCVGDNFPGGGVD